MREIIQLAAAFFGALGFALVFNLKGSSMLWSSLGGMLSWGVYLTAAIYFKGEGIRYFFAALFLGLYAEVFARLKKKPATVFLAVGFIPLIPGFSLYTTMPCALKNQRERFAFYGIQSLLIAGALASGIIVSLILFQLLKEFIKQFFEYFRKRFSK